MLLEPLLGPALHRVEIQSDRRDTCLTQIILRFLDSLDRRILTVDQGFETFFVDRRCETLTCQVDTLGHRRRVVRGLLVAQRQQFQPARRDRLGRPGLDEPQSREPARIAGSGFDVVLERRIPPTRGSREYPRFALYFLAFVRGIRVGPPYGRRQLQQFVERIGFGCSIEHLWCRHRVVEQVDERADVVLDSIENGLSDLLVLRLQPGDLFADAVDKFRRPRPDLVALALEPGPPATGQ